MRTRCISASDVQRNRRARGSNWPGAIPQTGTVKVVLVIRVHAVVADRGRGAAAETILHPSQTIGVFFNGEDFARVLLDSTVTFPDAAAFAGILEIWAEVGSATVAESFLEDLELFSVAAGNGDGDFDGPVDVIDWTTDAAGEARAALYRCEFFEC